MVKYILHFLKQEHISSRPDSSLSDTLHRHSDMSKNECPKLSGLDRIFYPRLPFIHDARGHRVRRSLITAQQCVGQILWAVLSLLTLHREQIYAL